MQYLMMLHFPPGHGPQEGTAAFEAEMRRWGELNVRQQRRARGARAPAAHRRRRSLREVDG